MNSSALSQKSLALFCVAAIASVSAPAWLVVQPLSAAAQEAKQLTGTAFFRDAQQRAVVSWYTDGTASLEYSDPWTGTTVYSTAVERQGDRLRFRMNNGSTIALAGWNFQVANFAVSVPQGNYLVAIPYVSHYDRDNTLVTNERGLFNVEAPAVPTSTPAPAATAAVPQAFPAPPTAAAPSQPELPQATPPPAPTAPATPPPPVPATRQPIPLPPPLFGSRPRPAASAAPASQPELAVQTAPPPALPAAPVAPAAQPTTPVRQPAPPPQAVPAPTVPVAAPVSRPELVVQIEPPPELPAAPLATPAPQPVAAAPQPTTAASPLQHAGCRRVIGFTLSALYTDIETSFVAADERGYARLNWSNFRNNQRGYCLVSPQGQVVEMRVN